MPAHQASLSALNELHRRYDGPVPEALLRAARHGSAARAELIAAEGDAAFYKSFLRGQIETIRKRRAEGSFYPALVTDLRYYRDGWRRHHRRVIAARARIAAAPLAQAAE